MSVDAEHEAWLILLRTPALGGAGLRALLARDGSAAALLARLRRAPPAALPDAARAWLRAPERARIAADLHWLQQPEQHLLTCRDADFPPQLDACPGAPAALFVRGDGARLLLPQLAIVGARAATPEGLAHARRFAAQLGAAGLTISSGLAAGIDGAAHAGALDSAGGTVAVVGTGSDVVYPVRHRELAARIVARGALVSAFPPGTTPRAAHFPMRNRVLAGLALGVLVVEAGQRSGALITAHAGTTLGREVFALPGSIANPLARGCHRLIREGAQLVESAEEILDALRPAISAQGLRLSERLAQDADVSATSAAIATLDRDATRWLAALGHAPVALETLALRMHQPVAAAAAALGLLELEGRVARAAGGLWQRLPD
ncbi:DNA-processing protein DprA [Metallibacterium sp.]|uniref:DNA-processing protein DprA n=1 Tax=Metallibacterium sp. TaxID=2940281 RepID=UPI00261CBA3C|nr:DNA-processing protein DprA [Metallibacterium sp.]